ncbi:hypothetical protein [Amycolatopsis suaedae]|uniref:Uncharacterized protein n=1 Tax=Amycolatopsis suaedae TaxID=2510978 RepID=A0A4Q7J6I2_9PSEU|nr:hypothetical protein [Amycolatopsis suaedae]RZQ61913.1 hypothetical protein EWH70_20055 [Amycolatopsis suaedae]
MSEEARHRIPPLNLDLTRLGEVREFALRTAANGPDPVLAEMAREVRSGKLTLREAVASAAYREAFSVATEKALRAAREADDDAKAEVEGKSFDELVDRLARRNAELDAEEAAPDTSPAPEPEPDDEYFDGESFMVSQPRRDQDAESQAAPRRERWTRRWQ